MQDWKGLLREVEQRRNIEPAAKKIFHRSSKKFFLSEPFVGVYLTRREAQVAICLLRGYSFAGIGSCLSISGRTVEFYVTNIRKKMLCANKWELIQSLWQCECIQELM